MSPLITMDAFSFINSNDRLPTPAECTEQIKTLTTDEEVLHDAYSLSCQLANSDEPESFESKRLRYIWTEARLRAKRECSRYSYISVAQQAELPEEEIYEMMKGEPRDKDIMVEYYRPLVKQMIQWKALKTLFWEVVA